MARMELVTRQVWNNLMSTLGAWQTAQRADIDAALSNAQAATQEAEQAAALASEHRSYTDAEVGLLAAQTLLPTAGLTALSAYPSLKLLNTQAVPDFAPSDVTRKVRTDMQFFPNVPGLEVGRANAGNLDMRWYHDSTPLKVPTGTGAQAICAAVWLDDPADISSLSISLATQAGTAYQWTRGVTGLKKGWNFLRIQANAGVITTWNAFYRIRLLAITTRAARVVWGGLWAECPTKARAIMIADGSYRGWYENLFPTQIVDAQGQPLPSIYQALKQRGYPTTWAWNPLRTMNADPADTATTAVLDMEKALALRYDPMSYHSFHSWASATGGFKTTAEMTATEFYQDNLMSQRWLTSTFGVSPERLVRAAVHQNSAPNWGRMEGMMAGSASWHSASGVTIFPWLQPFDIPRLSIHGRDRAWVDAQFETLKTMRGTALFYTHKLIPNGTGPAQPVDINQSEWEYFLAKLDAAVAEGWLEVTSFEPMYDSLKLNPTQQRAEQGMLQELRRALY